MKFEFEAGHILLASILFWLVVYYKWGWSGVLQGVGVIAVIILILAILVWVQNHGGQNDG